MNLLEVYYSDVSVIKSRVLILDDSDKGVYLDSDSEVSVDLSEIEDQFILRKYYLIKAETNCYGTKDKVEKWVTFKELEQIKNDGYLLE